MSDVERQILRAAATLTGGRIRLVEYAALANHLGMPETQVRAASGRLRTLGFCQATFGGLQLTASGIVAASED